MEIEQQQSELIQNLVKEATTLPSSSLPTLITQATSNPSLFAFSDLLSLPTLLQLQGTENSGYLHLLRLFAYGTWLDYKSNAFTLPKLLPEQIVKLKQLTVLSLVHFNKELLYDELLQELELANVRELEDFLINECMYAGIVKGKLNQLRRCFEVQYAAGRDLIEGELGSMIETLNKWQVTSENMLYVIQEKIEWACKMSLAEKNHQKEVQDNIEQAKNALKYSGKSYHRQGHNLWGSDGLLDYEGGLLDHENFPRSKRRRSPTFPRQSRQGYHSP